jgi:hypothetical protein
MANNYRGIYLIGNKAAGKVTNIQVVDIGGSSISLSLTEYLNRGVRPNYQLLSWQEDLPPKVATPKS